MSLRGALDTSGGGGGGGGLENSLSMHQNESQQLCSNECSNAHTLALSCVLLNLGSAVHNHTALIAQASSGGHNVVEERIDRSPFGIVTIFYKQITPGMKRRSTLCAVCPGRLLGRQEPRRSRSYLLGTWQAQRSTHHKHARVLWSENAGLHLIAFDFN